ncbi:MAG: hypothetical protein ACR2MS_04565 [Weeksellaceae bacterium]
MKNLKFIFLLLPFIAFAQVGVNTDKPTETIHVEGTTRIKELPITGTANSIYTQPNGNASATKNQPFNAIKTVVVDQNGVLGTIQGLPVTALPEIKTIQYATKTALINSNTPTNSITQIGNLRVRFDGTKPDGTEQTLSFMLINNITDPNRAPANADNVIVNQLKIGSGGIYGGQDTYFSAPKDAWRTITNQAPNVRNNDFVQYNISLINTKEVYRLTVMVNRPISATVNSVAEVTLFLERLTDQK